MLFQSWQWDMVPCCIKGGLGGGEGEGLYQKAVGMEQSPQGSGQSSELPELKEHLETALRHGVWIFGGPVWRQVVDSIIPVGAFQLRIFCDSVILFFPVYFPVLRFLLSSVFTLYIHPCFNSKNVCFLHPPFTPTVLVFNIFCCASYRAFCWKC